MATKVEMMDELKKFNIEFDEESNYRTILKIHKEEMDKGTFNETPEDFKVYDPTDVDELTIRERLIIEIVEFMTSIKGKTRGTPEEVKRMFYLYNNFYKRNETAGCSKCVGNVYQKLMGVYKKYSK